jgi:hypothetical protein
VPQLAWGAANVPIRRAQRDGLVAILVLGSHPTIEIVMPDIAAPENDQAGLELLLVGDEFHLFASHCAETVQNGDLSA